MMPTHPITRHGVVTRLIAERNEAAERHRLVRDLHRRPPTTGFRPPTVRIAGPRTARLRLVAAPPRPATGFAEHDVA